MTGSRHRTVAPRRAESSTTDERATFARAMPSESAYKGKTGLRRILQAARNSLDGLAAALRHEDAFRQELMLAAVLVPLGLWLGKTGVERALLVGTLLLVLIVELLNSAIEATVDRISLDPHPLAKRAKDLASAAVMLALVLAGLTWALLLLA
jgi:diacylglycerol kinase (ATP)